MTKAEATKHTDQAANVKKKPTPPNGRSAWWGTAALPGAVAEDAGVTKITGTAWVFGVRDRNGRIIESGAFGSKPFTVPLLAYHDDTNAIGTALMTPLPDRLIYEATFVQGVAEVDDIRKRIEGGAIAAVSIGWCDDEGTSFYSADWETLTFPDATCVELSVCPVPAHPLVTLQAASLDFGVKLETADLVEIYRAIGKRNSSTDMERIQQMHDLASELGADCTQHADSDDENASLADKQEAQPDINRAAHESELELMNVKARAIAL